MRTTHQGTISTFQCGFTLIELMASVAILAILASIAAPSFAQLRQNTVRRAAMDDFWHAIFLARSEAIKRNSVTTLCKSADGVHCNNASGNWADGWLVFENLDHDSPAQRDEDEPILQRYSPRAGIRITSSPGRKTFSYGPTTQGTANGTITFCDARGASEARAIIISLTGRPRQSTRDADNKPLTCS